MKTIVIGLEGVDPDRLLSDPGLVNVRALAMEGASGRLSDLPTVDSASPWLTLASGREARPLDDVGGGNQSASGSSIVPPVPSGPMLWDLLGNQGEDDEVILIDVPRTTRPRSTINVDIRPADLAAEVRSRIDWPGFDDGASAPVSRTQARFLALRHVMEARPWSYAQLVDDVPAQLLGSAGDEVSDRWYEMLDGELGRLLQGMTDEVSVLLVSVSRPGPVDPGGAPRSASTGAFVLATSRGLPSGEFDGARLVDLAPTLLAIAGRAIPEGITGRPLGLHQGFDPTVEDEEAVLERLRGLGYLA